jgi:hypothetical protein
VHQVIGHEWKDWIIVDTPDAMLPSDCTQPLTPGQFGHFGDVRASYAYLRTNSQGVQQNLAAKGATTVGTILSSEEAIDLDVSWEAEGRVRVTIHSAVPSTVKITLLADGSNTILYLDGKPKTDFTSDDKVITFAVDSQAA